MDSQFTGVGAGVGQKKETKILFWWLYYFRNFLKTNFGGIGMHRPALHHMVRFRWHFHAKTTFSFFKTVGFFLSLIHSFATAVNGKGGGEGCLEIGLFVGGGTRCPKKEERKEKSRKLRVEADSTLLFLLHCPECFSNDNPFIFPKRVLFGLPLCILLCIL